MSTHIVAMGGGGFSMAPNSAPTSLDRYLVDVSGERSPLVCFVPTASADSAPYINRFLMAYSGLGVRTMVLTLWQGAAESVKRLPEADVVLVGGGNTVNMLALWDAHGVSRTLKLMAADTSRTMVLGGLSAGGACWFEGCLTDAFGEGLALLDRKAQAIDRARHAFAGGEFYLEVAGMLPGGHAVDDGVAVHFENGKYTDVLAEREGPTALRLMPSTEPTASGVLTEILEPEVL